MANYDMTSGFMQGFEFGTKIKERRQNRKAASLLSSWNASSYDTYIKNQTADKEGELIGTNLLEELNLADLSDELKSDWTSQARSWRMSGRTKDQTRQGLIDLAPQYRKLNNAAISESADTEVATLAAPTDSPFDTTVTEFSKLMDIETSPSMPNAERLVAVSNKGAIGISQIMPATAMQPGYQLDNIFDLADSANMSYSAKTEDEAKRLLTNELLNKQMGFNYYNMLKDKYDGDTTKALIGYNAGPDVADLWDGSFSALPEETQNYLRKFGIDIDSPEASMASVDSQMRDAFSSESTGKKENTVGGTFREFLSNPWQSMKDSEAAEVELIVLNKLGLSSMDDFRKYQSAYVPVGLKFTENGAVALDSRIDRSVIGKSKEDQWKSGWMADNGLDPSDVNNFAKADKAWKLATTTSTTSTRDSAISGWLADNASDKNNPTPADLKAANDWWTSKPQDDDLDLMAFDAFKARYPGLGDDDAILTWTLHENNPEKLEALSAWRSSEAYKALKGTGEDSVADNNAIKEIETDMLEFLENNSEMTLPEFESLETTANNIINDADYKGSPEILQQAKDFIARSDAIKAGIIRKQPLDELEISTVFVPTFKDGVQDGVREISVKIRGTQILDAATNAEVQVPNSTGDLTTITTETDQLTLKIRSGAEQERISEITGDIEGNGDYKELIALRQVVITADQGAFQLANMAAKNPTVLTAAGGLNKLINDIDKEFGALKQLFGVGNWNQGAADTALADMLAGVEERRVSSMEGGLGGYGAIDEVAAQQKANFEASLIRYIFAQGKALGQSGNGFSNKDYSNILNSVANSKDMFAFRRNMVTLVKSNAQNYENLRVSVGNSLFTDYYSVIEKGSEFDKYTAQGIFTPINTYLRDNDNSESNPSFSNRYGELAQFMETEYPEDATTFDLFTGEIGEVISGLESILANPDTDETNKAALQSALTTMFEYRDRGLTYLFAYNSSSQGIQVEGYK
jgi:hypothetical protein